MLDKAIEAHQEQRDTQGDIEEHENENIDPSVMEEVEEEEMFDTTNKSWFPAPHK